MNLGGASPAALSVSVTVCTGARLPADFELLRADVSEFMNSTILYTGHSTCWSLRKRVLIDQLQINERAGSESISDLPKVALWQSWPSALIFSL